MSEHNPWLIDNIIINVKSMAKELRFRIEPGAYNNIEVRADHEPYGKDIMLGRFDDWRSAEIYLNGYLQGKLEVNAAAVFAKSKAAAITRRAKKEKNA